MLLAILEELAWSIKPVSYDTLPTMAYLHSYHVPDIGKQVIKRATGSRMHIEFAYHCFFFIATRYFRGACMEYYAQQSRYTTSYGT